MSEEVDLSVERYILKKKLKFLEKKQGFHTELVSLYIPPTKKISDMTTHLKNEIAESSNIKSKLTRKNVIDSITSILGQLRNFSKTPEKGMAIFSGAIPQSNSPGTEKNEIYIVHPPDNIPHFKYYCASTFWLDPLYDMVTEKDVYGIIQIDNKEAAIAWLRGSHLEIVDTYTSGIHSKHSAGGQSQRRFERLIEEGAYAFYGRVGEHAKEVFLSPDLNVRGIFVAGAGMSKQKFVESKHFDDKLREKLIDMVDVSYSGVEGIRETINKIQDSIQNLGIIQDKKLFGRFMTEVSKDSSLAIYGEDEIRNAVEMGAVDLLLISEAVEEVRLKAICQQCKYEILKTSTVDEINKFLGEITGSNCPECNGTLWDFEEQDLIDEIIDHARSKGAKTHILSTETEEGDSLLNGFGGMAAVLRYKIDY